VGLKGGGEAGGGQAGKMERGEVQSRIQHVIWLGSVSVRHGITLSPTSAIYSSPP
jgi:hypothetical protein